MTKPTTAYTIIASVDHDGQSLDVTSWEILGNDAYGQHWRDQADAEEICADLQDEADALDADEPDPRHGVRYSVIESSVPFAIGDRVISYEDAEDGELGRIKHLVGRDVVEVAWDQGVTTSCHIDFLEVVS